MLLPLVKNNISVRSGDICFCFRKYSFVHITMGWKSSVLKFAVSSGDICSHCSHFSREFSLQNVFLALDLVTHQESATLMHDLIYTLVLMGLAF